MIGRPYSYIFTAMAESKKENLRYNIACGMATLHKCAQTRAATLLTRMNKLLKEVQSRQIRL